MINKLFDLLDDWRNLPSYQLERRADIFFAIFLEKIIKCKRNVNIDYIIPEFPVRVGDVYEKHSELNKSFKVDYLVYSSVLKRAILIELKTDQSSRNEKQDWYLKEASNLKISGLIDGLIKIYTATKQKQKYNNLIEKIEKIGWVKRENGKLKNCNINLKPEIIYIQPLNINNEENVISFNDIRKYLSDLKDAIAKRFIISLQKWEKNPNALFQ
jgi:hypothetical protein